MKCPCWWAYTPVMSSVPVIRSLRQEDREIVGQLAYQTGFFGLSAERYFPARPLFEFLWTGPYFQTAAPLGFLAERHGQAVGYVIGCASQAQYQRALLRTLPLGLWSRLHPFCPVWRSLRYLSRAAIFSPAHANWRQYPAHLHINLLPQARGFRLGEQLLQAYLNVLTERGVTGVQLSTTTENHAALGLYRKFGFQVLGSQVTPLWTPWLGHPAHHLIMGRSLVKEQD